ncbi:Ribonuclease P protein subunit p21 [Blyttiomyces sp. JEL0837]|nr:Ribonuclease P protein subunit p21 [Blyttiomyces sp. JEL0837]
MNFLLQAATLYSAVPKQHKSDSRKRSNKLHADSESNKVKLPEEANPPEDAMNVDPLEVSNEVTSGEAIVEVTSNTEVERVTSWDVQRQKEREAAAAGRRLPPIKVVKGETFTEMSRFYASNMKRVARRLVLRLDPQVKRSICKCCEVVLVPGVTSHVEIKEKPELLTELSCLFCGMRRRLPCRPDHVLFTESAVVGADDAQ